MPSSAVLTKPYLRKVLVGKPAGPSESRVVENVRLLLDNFLSDDILGYKTFHGEIKIDEFELEVVNPSLDKAIARGGDVILIPLFGWNVEGYRLGRGGGFYDRLLKAVPDMIAIGVGSQYRMVDFQAEEHDVRMDIIVTDVREILYTV